jgi:PPOX class probable F420-dependent enzyme
MRRLVGDASVGRLATVAADGRPHLVPICFVLLGDTVYSAVDHKPKSTTRLRRLENLRDTGSACLLVDHYDSDWSRLWWIRLDGVGRVIPHDRDPDPGRLAHRRMVLASLADKYEQYAATPPAGPVMAIDITEWRGWSADGLDARP